MSDKKSDSVKLKDFLPSYLQHVKDRKTVIDLIDHLGITKAQYYALKARVEKQIKDSGVTLPKLATGDLEKDDILEMIKKHHTK